MRALRLNDGLYRQEADRLRREKQVLDAEQALCFQEYQRNCLKHNQPLSANCPTEIPGYAVKARVLRVAVWAGAILATGVFGLLNLVSLGGSSSAAIFAGSFVSALLIGIVGHVTVAHLTQVDVENPRSAGRAKLVILIGGFAALSSFAFFLYLRFAESEYARAALPTIALLFELGLLTLVAASCDLLPLYSWPGRLSRQFREAQERLDLIDRTLAACTTQFDKQENHDDDLDENDAVRSLGCDPLNMSSRKPNGSAGNHPRRD